MAQEIKITQTSNADMNIGVPKNLNMAQQTDSVFKTSNSGWADTATLNLNPTPFSVTFTWSGKSITVQLDNGEDVLKLANIFSEFLTNNGITNIIKNE
jgi:hypothetical protein